MQQTDTRTIAAFTIACGFIRTQPNKIHQPITNSYYYNYIKPQPLILPNRGHRSASHNHFEVFPTNNKNRKTML